MRAAFGLAGLLLVLAIVMINARNSAQSLKASAPQGAASAGEPVRPEARTEAVRQQVQGLVDQAAQRASQAAEP